MEEAAPEVPKPQMPRRGLLHNQMLGHFFVLALFIVGGYFFGERELRFFLVPSGSMEPTLLSGDQVATLNQPGYKRGDIVVLYDQLYNEYITKRIVGLPGDVIQITDGALFINGVYASEPYVLETMNYVLGPMAIDPGQVLLLGDNRNESEDSHIDGRTYAMENIIGRVRLVYFPYGRFGPLRSYPLTNLDGL